MYIIITSFVTFCFQCFQDTYTTMREIPTKSNQFLKLIETDATNSVLTRGDATYRPCDELVMASAIHGNDVIMDSVSCYAMVEMDGQVTRGQMVVDWREKLNKKPNVHIITDLNMNMYKQLLFETASGNAC